MITALSYLRSMGVGVHLDGDHTLDVQAQWRMSEDQWEDVLSLAKEFKPEIIQDLKIEQDLGKLLRQVGVHAESGPKLVFTPPLGSPKCGPGEMGQDCGA